MKLVASAPASAANLGPGFDCLGLALDLVNEVELDTDGPPGTVAIEGEGAGELPEDGGNLIVRAMERVAGEVGEPLPPASLRCANRIPIERGLGSSAAAAVGGLVLADRLLGSDLPRRRLFELAVELEGHPDNVAAALFGGLVLAYRGADGAWQVETLAPAEGLRPAVLVPREVRVPTAEARRALPATVPLEDAAFTAGRAALAVVALTARPDLLREALADRLHQPARLALVPEVAEVFRAIAGAGVPVCVSGAGPSLLAFESDDVRVPELGPGWTVRRVSPRPVGAEARRLD